MKYFIRLSYNGAMFSGWQKQNNACSIQQELEKAFATLLKEEIKIVGAGRTDRGVNAINYIAHIQADSPMPVKGRTKRQFIYKINAILPTSIVVHNIFLVDDKAHARFDAIERTYNYFIHLSPDPFTDRFSLFVKGELDFEAMNRAAQYFIGRHDFKSLQKIGSDNKTTICTVTEAYWKKYRNSIPFNSSENRERYCFVVSADRFLRNMVRAMVGSLLEVGQGKRPVEWIQQMLKEQDRSAAGMSVPGNPLFLTNIKYPYKIK